MRTSKYVLGGAAAVLVAVLVFLVGMWCLCCLRFSLSEDVVSGIVYDAEFDEFISGNTHFKIRASADMAVNEKTSDIFCLPPGDEQTEIVRRAASDKNVKVAVVRDKFVGFVSVPWECAKTVHVQIMEEK